MIHLTNLTKLINDYAINPLIVLGKIQVKYQ